MSYPDMLWITTSLKSWAVFIHVLQADLTDVNSCNLDYLLVYYIVYFSSINFSETRKILLALSLCLALEIAT